MLEQWLRSIGMEERLPAFAAERITLADLPHLTDGELRELGLTIGERGRFRRALQERGMAEPGAAWTAAGPPASVADDTPRGVVQGERRPLTVMFVDIVDSMAISEQLGDEEVLDVIRRFREVCGAAITRTGGRITKYLGDGILAGFGHPIAQENDPQRAVRAALEIAGGIGAIRPRGDLELAVRVGVATGSVILSDLFDGGEPELRSFTGSPVNLAARLQEVAPAGGVVIADSTYERVAHLFDCEDLGPRPVKGLKDPVRCWRVRGEAQRRPRGVSGPALPIRGRDAELARLDALWRDAAQGQGRAALLRGEAGVGKTALLEQFLRRHGLSGAALVTVAGSELDYDTPFFPVAELLAGVRADADNAELSPPQQRERVLAAMVEALLAPAAQAPLCLVVEDLHWLDPSTIELLARLVDRLEAVPALLLMTARAEFEPPWRDDGRVAALTVGRLHQEEVRAMAADLLGTADIPRALLAQIVERTDGVPLFVQEVVRRVRHRFAGPGRPEWGEQDAGDVPSSLQEALMGRLDRVGAAKGVAQAAAVIGRRVDRALLGRVVELDPPELERRLLALVDGGVLSRDGAHEFSFSHALVRETAYGSLLRDARRALHGRAADALRELRPVLAEDQPATMALHLTGAGRVEQAGRLWLEAGRRAVAASALTEATRLLKRGLAAVEGMAASTERARLELQLLGLLGPALMALRGAGAPETREHYERSYELCQTLDEEPAHFPLYWGWWRVATDYHTMHSRSDWMLSRAKSHRETGVLLQSHHCNWATSYHLGDFRRCCEHIECGLQLYGAEDWRHHAPLYGNHDARVCALGELALVRYMQGHVDGGAAHHDQSLVWARELRHLGSLIHGMDFALVFHTMRQSHAAAYRAAEELTALTVEHGFKDHEAKGRIYRGWALAMSDDPTGGLNLLRQGFAMQQDIGTSEDFPIYVCLLAEALIAAGKPEAAIAELLAARTQFDQTGLRIWLPEVLRVTAAAMAAASHAAVLPLLSEAAGVAAEQGVPLLGLRVAIDRATALAKSGDLETAETILERALQALPARGGREFDQAVAFRTTMRQRQRLLPAC